MEDAGLSAKQSVNDLLEVLDDIDSISSTAFLDIAFRRLSNSLNQVNGSSFVTEVIDQLFSELNLRQSRKDERYWSEFIIACRSHPIFQLLREVPLVNRCYEKPRGYAGDPVMIDYLYDEEVNSNCLENVSELGKMLTESFLNHSMSRAVRARRRKIAAMICETAQTRSDAEIMAFAAGHLREAALIGKDTLSRLKSFIAFDNDIKSVEEIKSCYGDFGIKAIHGSIRQLLLNKVKSSSFDLTYSLGLFDYLLDKAATKLINIMFSALKPGGKLIIANLFPENTARGFLEVFVDWNLICRDHYQMLDLALTLPQEEVGDIKIFVEEGNSIIFLEVSRNITNLT